MTVIVAPLLKTTLDCLDKSSTYISHADINGDGYPLQLSKTY
jgi:hypothetical protein